MQFDKTSIPKIRSLLTGPNPRTRLYTSLALYLKSLKELLSKGYRTDSGSIAKLESNIAHSLGASFAVMTPMARVAIYLVVKALIKPNQKVILSPYTIADVVNMVICAGGRPVFADIEYNTCNIDAKEVERLIDDETGAVLVTHFYGLACDVEKISIICAAKKIPLIEDSAQSFGSNINGKPVGTFGAAGIFSFGLYKNITSFLGGIIVTSNKQLRDRVYSEITTFPMVSRSTLLNRLIKGAITDIITFPLAFRSLFFWIFRFAYINQIGMVNNQLKIDINPRLKTAIPENYLHSVTPLQARLIMMQIDKLDADTKMRIEAARLYFDGLSDFSDLILPPKHFDGRHLYTYFPIRYADRHRLVRYLAIHNRDIQVSHHRNCASLPCFSNWYSDCPNAEATASSLIYLPTYPSYGIDEVKKNIAVIRMFFAKEVNV